MMADLLILDPTLTNEQVADQLGLHYMTVQIVRRSDMFKAMMTRRRDRLEGRIEENYISRLQGKVVELAEVSIDTLKGQVERENAKLIAGVQQGTMETCEMALRSLGLIGPKGQGGIAPASPHLTVVVDNRVLASAQQRMRTIHANAGSSVDGEEVSNTNLLPAPAQLS
jgi:hypothetical protein